MTVSLFRTCTISDAGALDLPLYTSPHRLRITPRIPCPVKPSRNSFHGCALLSAVRLSSSHCTRHHPCTVTASHHPHARPPDILARLVYQGSLLNTYRTSDLDRLMGRQRERLRLALALTRSGTGDDLPGIQRDMSDVRLMMTQLPALLPVAVSSLAITDLKLTVKTVTPLGPVTLGIFLS
jgi:hypothetical protein